MREGYLPAASDALIHDPAHFGSFGNAFLTLFRLVTLDNWADIFNTQLAQVPAIKVAIYFVTIILLASAGLERDGAVFMAGCVQFMLCLGFFALLGLGGSEVWQRFFS